MPITPNIIQTMKQTVKARVLTISTDQACRLCCGSLFMKPPAIDYHFHQCTRGLQVWLSS